MQAVPGGQEHAIREVTYKETTPTLCGESAEHAGVRNHLPLRMCMSSHLLSMCVVACEAGTCSVTKSDPLSSSLRVSTGVLFPMGICAHRQG